MRTAGKQLLGCLAIAATIYGLAFVLLFPWGNSNTIENARHTGCISNVKLYVHALLLYEADNERLPPRDLWMDASLDYLVKDGSYNPQPDPLAQGVTTDRGLLPEDSWLKESRPAPKKNYPPISCPVVQQDHKDWIGYAFNSRLERKRAEDIARPEEVPMVYDSINHARNASDPVASLPVPGRHKGKNSIGYADGHAKRVAPTAMATEPEHRLGRRVTSCALDTATLPCRTCKESACVRPGGRLWLRPGPRT